MTKISIIIPAYNEEKRIKGTLDNLLKVFGDAEIMVVSNGSKDKTIEILEEYKSKNINLDYLDFSDKLGKGGAIVEGLKKVDGDWIGFIDADDAFDLNEIKKILEINSNFDCIIASKWKGKNIFQVNEPFLRKVMSRGWNILVKVFLGLYYRDTQAGAKFFKNKVKESIGLDFISKGFAFDVELLNKIKSKGFSIKEVYIPSKFVEGSTFSLKYCGNMFKDFIRIHLRIIITMFITMQPYFITFGYFLN